MYLSRLHRVFNNNRENWNWVLWVYCPSSVVSSNNVSLGGGDFMADDEKNCQHFVVFQRVCLRTVPRRALSDFVPSPLTISEARFGLVFAFLKWRLRVGHDPLFLAYTWKQTNKVLSVQQDVCQEGFLRGASSHSHGFGLYMCGSADGLTFSSGGPCVSWWSTSEWDVRMALVLWATSVPSRFCFSMLLDYI